MQWGWQAATDKLREVAYTRAIRRTRLKRIMKRLLRRLAPSYLLARIREVITFLTTGLWRRSKVPPPTAAALVATAASAVRALTTAAVMAAFVLVAARIAPVPLPA